MDLIVGAGISGLSYAWFSNNDYLVLEKTGGIGGYCKTTKRNGFVWDYSVHFFNTKLYACDLNRLDKDAMGRFFPYAEKEDIIKNFKAGNNNSYNATFVYPKGGAFEYAKESWCEYI